MGDLTRFQIKGLHSRHDLDLRLKDNTLILVGENGAGKTTALRLLFYSLTGQWANMAAIDFEEVVLTIDGKRRRLRKENLVRLVPKLNKAAIMHLPQPIRRQLSSAISRNGLTTASPEIDYICDRYGLSIDSLTRNFVDPEAEQDGKTKAVSQELVAIDEAISAQVLYLPTYRRIEQELSLIYEGVDELEMRHRRNRIARQDQARPKAYVELVEFGMKDVEEDIERTVNQMNQYARESLNELTFGYLGAIVERQYEQVDVGKIEEASESVVEKILNRIQEPVLSASNKEHLRAIIGRVRSGETPDFQEKVVCHYFVKLMHFQQELEALEAKIVGFCNVCNEYMVDKIFSYDTNKFRLTVRRRDDDSEAGEIEFQNLSSGEKQIVSLFSHLYLSGNQSYFVLIDEPELSLSVPWQRRFLEDIRRAEFCAGLVAVTHSPFIYDNSLEGYARSIGEFIA